MIGDFSRSQGDRIDLTGIDANTWQSGNQAFTMIGSAAFSGAAGQLHYQHSSGRTIVEGDVNGDRVADFQVELVGRITLSSGDFVL